MAGVKLLRFMDVIAATGFHLPYRLSATNYFFSSARMSLDPPVDLRFSGMVLHKVGNRLTKKKSGKIGNPKLILKIREKTVVTYCLAFIHFDFTRKIAKIRAKKGKQN